MTSRKPSGWPVRIAEAWRLGGGLRQFARIVLLVLPMIFLAWAFDDGAGMAWVDQWDWGRTLAIVGFLVWGAIVLALT